MRRLRRLGSLFWVHPLFWVACGAPLFLHLCKLPVNSWSVEILIARNLLDGHGFVVGPLDPPALWRPPLTVFALLPFQLLLRDPHLIYAAFCTLALVGLMVSVFYLMRQLGGALAGHVAQALILITPAFTTLVSRQGTLMGNLLLFGLVALSILLTLRSWQQPGWKRDLWAGLCWGLAFLTRPEVVPLFGVGLVVVFAFQGRLGVSRRGASQHVAFQTLGFLAIVLPSVLVFASLQSRHHLIGQAPLLTHYAGARLAENALQGDHDGQGYAESVRRFGKPEAYHNSLVRFMVSHPEAIASRVHQNLRTFGSLLKSSQLIDLWDCLAFVAFSSVLVFARRPSLPTVPLVAYMTLLLAASPYFLLFHVDARYPLLFVLLLVLWLLVLTLAAWTWLASRLNMGPLGKRPLLVSIVGLAVLCGLRLSSALAAAGQETANLAPWQRLAESFRSRVGSGGTPVVGLLDRNGQLIFGGDSLWFSYFARTAIPWCGGSDDFQGGVFPRDRIYSFRGKPQDYLWAADTNARAMAFPHRVLVEGVTFDKSRSYSLLHLVPASSPVKQCGVIVGR